MIGRTVYTVSEVTKAIKEIISAIGELWVEGEVSNFRQPYSGHIYFTLKDEFSQIQCVIFKPLSLRLPFRPKDGMRVLLHGRLTVYEKGGNYQIVGDRIEPAGLGALQMALEQLKRKLAAEGLFDERHKKPIPKFPKRIGVVTSATGAAIRDIIKVISRRYPLVHILLHPVTVQGENAAREIAEAIDRFNRLKNVDLLIVGRGGGSIEDLWAFNEEIVARSIFRSEIPVISAVGHEIDITISDLVADLRAPTPSAAAEMAVPSLQDLMGNIGQLRSRMIAAIKAQIRPKREKLDRLSEKVSPQRKLDELHEMSQRIDELYYRAVELMRGRISAMRGEVRIRAERLHGISPERRLRELEGRLNLLIQRAHHAVLSAIRERRSSFRSLVSRLEALSPLAVLKRGYSICQDASGRIISDAAQVEVGDQIVVKPSRGKLRCEVLEREDG
ncbi:TPA: exodeoxyribonuclease VII large subunit [Candidatus Poribacteria bacterium]|nr:exodeoxyribonuclease VII large subunit [Candidatus Poribacteria bacterium]